MQPTAHIVDDLEANRVLLESLMKSVGIQAGSYSSALEFLGSFDADQPGCLLLDVRMPEMSGLELQQELNERGIDVPVIIVTAHSDVHIAIQAMKSGAFDFVEKPINNQHVLDLVNRGFQLSKTRLTQRLEIAEIRRRHDQLSQRECEVLGQMMDGQLNKQIAHTLGISQRTVEVHRANVMDKMQAPSLADLVKQVMRLRDPG